MAWKAYGGDRDQQKIHSHTGARCPMCAQAHGMLYQALSGELHFPEAFEIWMAHRTVKTNGVRTNASYIAKRTERDYRCCAQALGRFQPFKKLRLDQLGPDQLMDYQDARAVNPPDSSGEWRCKRAGTVRGSHATREAAEAWAQKQGGNFEFIQAAWLHPAGANRIRKEIKLMQRLLRDARLWGKDEDDVFLSLRPVESDVIRAMTAAEQHRFLHMAASREKYRLVYQYAIVALQTTASTNELRALRLGDIFLEDHFIQIQPAGAKNKYRIRTIPLITEDAVWALEGLIRRARELGSTHSSHYLFPLRINPGRCKPGQVAADHYDPCRPMSDSGLKKQWDVVRKAALLPDLRIYDLRHTGITRMAEAGVPLPVAMSFAGHMTQQMQRRYTAISLASQRGWGATVWGDGELRNGGPVSVTSELSGAWPARKPVAVEKTLRYQDGQHFHRRA